jgi:hypothetical protein
MNLRFPIDLVTSARVLADVAEQVAQEVRRMSAALKSIVDDFQAIYDALSRLIDWLKSKQVCQPAQA